MIQIFLLLLIMLGTGCGRSMPLENDDHEVLAGYYFGLEPPGQTAQIFASHIITGEVHSTAIFSPDLTEVYWVPMNTARMQVMKMTDGIWGGPQTPSFAMVWDADDPAFSADGQTLYFTSNRPAGFLRFTSKENIWCVQRKNAEWSSAEMLPLTVNSIDIHWAISVASNGNLYFGGKTDIDSFRDIYCSRCVNGQFEPAESLPPPVCSDIGDETPFIAPDERYILFSRWAGGNTWPDIWISVKNEEAAWGEPQILDSRVNSSAADNCPALSPDGKYLFFISNRSGEFRIYWVDASVLNAYME